MFTELTGGFFAWLAQTSFATYVHENAYLFPILESAHVLAITLVVGSISVVDLRLLGVASRGRPIGELMREVLPLTWIAFAIAAITGGIMFISNAVEYAQNMPFRVKLLLMAAAGVNMLVFHLVVYRAMQGKDGLSGPLWGARLAGATSLLLWVGVVGFGRWIGFTVGM